MSALYPICRVGDSDAVVGQCYTFSDYYNSTGNWISAGYDTGIESNGLGSGSNLVFNVDTPSGSYTRYDSVVVDYSSSVKFQIRTAGSETALTVARWGANDGSGSFSTTSYYESGNTQIVIDTLATGQRWVQIKAFLETTDTKFSPSLDNVGIYGLQQATTQLDVLDNVLNMDDIEIIVDGQKEFVGTVENISTDYMLNKKVAISGYGPMVELQHRIVRWLYEDYIHDIVRDVINRFNTDGKIQIAQSTGTNSTFANGDKTVVIAGLDLTSITNPEWIRLKQSATEYKWYKIDSITNATVLELGIDYSGDQITDANFIIDDLDCDDFTSSGLVFAQQVNESISGVLAYLNPLGIAMFWVDNDYKLHFKKQDVTNTPDHTYFKDYNVKVLSLNETSEERRNRGHLFGGVFRDNFFVTDKDATSITDSSKNYSDNLYRGRSLTVLYDADSGDEVGNVYHIQTNTSDKLTIGTNGIDCGDYVEVTGRVFEVIQDLKSIRDTGKIREFIITDASIINPSYGQFVLIKMMDQHKENIKEGQLELPFGDLELETGDIVDLRGFTDDGDSKTYWDMFNWDESNWSDESFGIFRFHLTKFTTSIDTSGLRTSLEIENSLPKVEDMFKDIDARMRNSEQEVEEIPQYQYLSDFIDILDDTKPEGSAIGDSFNRGLQISIGGSVIRWE